MNVVGVELWPAAAAAFWSLPRLLIINTIAALFIVALNCERPRRLRMAVIFVAVSTSVQFLWRTLWP